MHTIRRTAYASALALAVGTTAACGSAGTTTRTASATSARSASATATAGAAAGHRVPAAAVSQTQLEAASLSGPEVPGLQADQSGDHDGVDTMKFVAETGAPECTVLLNAVNASGLAYHSLAEVDRSYGLTSPPDATGFQIGTTLTSYASVAGAQRIVGDARASVKGCPSLRYTLNGNALAMNQVTALSLPTTGDDSTAVRAVFVADSNAPMPMVEEVIRVGTVVLCVYVYNDADPSALLQRVATAATAKLRHEEALWAG
jgi:hypothetical protein